MTTAIIIFAILFALLLFVLGCSIFVLHFVIPRIEEEAEAKVRAIEEKMKRESPDGYDELQEEFNKYREREKQTNQCSNT